MATYKSPGVYRQEVFLKPKGALPTGVPGFVGFANEASGGETPPNLPVGLHRKEEFVARFKNAPKSYLLDAVNGFFDNGGAYCYVVRADASIDPGKALLRAVGALASLSDLDLVAVPDAMALTLANGHFDRETAQQVQKEVLTHCAKQANRFALLDAIKNDPDGIKTDSMRATIEQRISITTDQRGPVNGALYYPWVKTAPDRIVPPCGHIAGIYARSDERVGVFKAPANEDVRGVIDLELAVDQAIQDQLNPEGINCLRAFPGRGIRVWGARTLSRDPTWRYVNIRRLVLTLARWIDANTAWAAFEPNTPRLWMRIQREMSVYMSKLWQAGALKGETSDQAFYIKCDAETNPQEEREAGKVVTEIGLAPTCPAEFIVVRIIHRAGTTEVD
jgi:uncharacterized protein